MCILSYLKPGTPVDEDGLFNGGLHNPDGHGWAIADGSTLIVGKSLELIEALDDFIAARNEHPEGHALFHSRWATHGKITTANVHPFYAGHSERTVVAHNGILPREAHPAKGDERSDTRKFADELLSTKYRRLDKHRAFTALQQWIGNGNKLVILTTDPRYRQQAYLVNEHLGQWDKRTGIWHSNADYRTAPWWTRHGKKGSTSGTSATVPVLGAQKGTQKAITGGQSDPLIPKCVYCEGLVGAGDYCTVCGTCQDCLESTTDCICFTRWAETMRSQQWAKEWSESREAQQLRENAARWYEENMPY